jgi:acyl carrier protein
MDTILVQLKRLVREQMSDYVRDSELVGAVSLFGSELDLDSLGAVQLISLTEEHFGTEFEAQDLTEENFKSLQTVADLITYRLASKRLKQQS